MWILNATHRFCVYEGFSFGLEMVARGSQARVTEEEAAQEVVNHFLKLGGTIRHI